MRNAILGSAVVGALAFAAPALAASFTVTPGSVSVIPSSPANDFKPQLNAEGLFNFTSTGASISLSGPTTVKFEYMGSESGNVNSFEGGSLASYFENNSGWGAQLIGKAYFNGGAFTNVSFNKTLLIGSNEFGIFLPGRTSFNSKVLYFGLDDLVTGPQDDNHDDFIVRVTAVPEPASWAMLIAGFSLVGITARRRTMKEVTA
jgi:hypothetical protein